MLVSFYILKKRILDRGLSLFTTISKIKSPIQAQPDLILTRTSPGVVPNNARDLVYESLTVATATSLAILPLLTPTPGISGPPRHHPAPSSPEVVPADGLESKYPAHSELRLQPPSDPELIIPDSHEDPSSSASLFSICTATPQVHSGSACSTASEIRGQGLTCSKDSHIEELSTCKVDFRPHKDWRELESSSDLSHAASSTVFDNHDDPLADHDEL